MNYAEARELETGGFRWTTMNDGVIRTAAPCTGCTTPHATKQEAEQHFYDYCLDAVTEGTLADWSGCAVCDEPTKKTLGNRGLGMIFQPEPLCDEHRTKQVIQQLHTFVPGTKLIHS